MMTYELFKDVVAEKILEYMPLEYRNSVVEIKFVPKVNETLDGLNIIPLDGRNTEVTPTIYINNMYEEYKKCNDLEKVLRGAAIAMDKAFQQFPDIFSKPDIGKAKDNIVMQLVNTVQNKDLLKEMPHREYQDLSIIYRWLIDNDRKGISSTMITADFAEKLGMDEEQLFEAAAVNTKTLLPVTIRPMDEIIREMSINGDMQEEIVAMIDEKVPDDKMMYVISNNQGINGAVSMLYEDCLHKLAEKLGSDLYIMPSSLHEVIAVSTNRKDPNDLARMVEEINMDQVPLRERLSNQVYYYDKELRKLSLATDTPNKRLDGISAEVGLIYDSKNQFR